MPSNRGQRAIGKVRRGDHEAVASQYVADWETAASDASDSPPPAKRARKARQPVKKAVKKTPIKKQRGAGKLSMLLTMPLDILYEVSHITSLTRTCRLTIIYLGLPYARTSGSPCCRAHQQAVAGHAHVHSGRICMDNHQEARWRAGTSPWSLRTMVG